MSVASIVAQLQTLIDASNETTGKTDIDLTTAVERLIRGWGGSAVQITEKDVTISSSNEYITFACDHEPDIVAIAATGEITSNYGAIGYIVYKENALGYTKFKNDGTSDMIYGSTSEINSTYPYGRAGGNGVAEGSYSNGEFTARARGYSGWNLNTFHCVAITL